MKKKPVKKPVKVKLTKDQKEIVALKKQVSDMEAKVNKADYDLSRYISKVNEATEGFAKERAAKELASRRIDMIVRAVQAAQNTLEEVPSNSMNTQELQRAVGSAFGQLSAVAALSEQWSSSNKQYGRGGAYTAMHDIGLPR